MTTKEHAAASKSEKFRHRRNNLITDIACNFFEGSGMKRDGAVNVD